MNACAVSRVDECDRPASISIEILVEAADSAPGWWGRLTRALATGNLRQWRRLEFCDLHGPKVIELASEIMDQPDLWAPGKARPSLFNRSARRRIFG